MPNQCILRSRNSGSRTGKAGLLFLLFLLITTGSHAQNTAGYWDHIDLGAGVSSNVASDELQPLWNYSRAQGTIRPFSNGITNQIWGNYEKSFSDNVTIELGLSSFFRLSDNADFYLQQFYAQSSLYFLRLKAGRKAEAPDVPIPDLSVGSFGINNQTTPLPEVKIEVPEFTPVPFTSDILWFKGRLAHAWLEEDRFVENAYLHEKDFYLSLYKEGFPLRASAGLNHFAQWQGRHPDVGSLGGSPDDYLRVLLGKGAEASEIKGEISNSQGNHLGYWDWRLKFPMERVEMGLYWMYPFEDGSGLQMGTLGDGIYGYHLTNKGYLSEWFNQAVVEFIYTRTQTGPGYSDPSGDEGGNKDEHGDRYGGRDNFYNNYVYRDGWTYNGLNMGMPLMITQKQHINYLGEQTLERTSTFTSNRVKAYHMGFNAKPHPDIRMKINATYAFHSGTYQSLDNAAGGDFREYPELRSNYVFYPALEQFYSQLKLQYLLNQKYTLDLALGWDSGELYNSAGIVAGIKVDIK